MPRKRDDMRRTIGASSSFFTRGAGFFFGRDVVSLPLGLGDAFAKRPEDCASRVSFLRSASRSAMLARRCFSNSEISSICERGMMDVAPISVRMMESAIREKSSFMSSGSQCELGSDQRSTRKEERERRACT